MPWYVICLPCALCLALGLLLGSMCAERKLLALCRLCQRRRQDMCESCAQRDIGELAAQAEMQDARDDAIDG